MTPEVIKHLSDLGMHFTEEDIQEAELKANGWTPLTAHPRCSIWKSPSGLKVPGPTYAFLLMKATKV